MSKTSPASPFQALEEEAYHAFREWPIWLALRKRELDAHLAAQGASSPTRPRPMPEQPPRHPTLDEGGQ